MSAVIRCPECRRRFRRSSSRASTIRCPFCEAQFDADEVDGEEEAPRRRGRSSGTNSLLILGLVGIGFAVFLLCLGGFGIWWLLSSTAGPGGFNPFAPQETVTEQNEDYAQARKHFQTKLVRQRPAPQSWENEQPPAGVREMTYQSGNLRLRTWVNAAPPDGRKRPAVLFLHGGFAFGADDWQQTQPFRDAGFVTMTPTLRGENGLPGAYSMFYNEIEDVLAAAETLAQLPYVDNTRIYIAGHSVGGTMTMLAAMASARFRAAASFSGSPDQLAWSRLQPLLLRPQVVPFDPTDMHEYQMRSPLSFPRSFKCPVRIYYGEQEPYFAANSQKLAQRAKSAGLDVEAVSVPGDHGSMVEPAMRQAIAFFQTK